MEIEVLGTEFNVNDRGGMAKIVLNSGKVQLKLKTNKTGDGITMVPGELIEYTDKKAGFHRKTVNPLLYTSWRNNKLIFEQTPVHEVIQLLEDNYGLEVVLINKALQDQTFTATLPANDADILLKALSKSFGLTLSREENRVILK